MLFSRYARSPIPQNEFSFLDKLCCESGSCNHRHVPDRTLVVLCTRSLQRCTKLCVHSSESSTQRSEQNVFIVSLKLPRSTIKNPFTAGSPTESTVSCSVWTKVQWDCVHCSSCVQVHLHPFKPLRTAPGTEIKTSK